MGNTVRYNRKYYKKHENYLRDKSIRNERGKVMIRNPIILVVDGREYDTFSIGELARRLNRSAQTVRKWEREGVIPEALRDPTNRRVYLLEHVEAIVKAANVCKIERGLSLKESGFPQAVRKAFAQINENLIQKQEVVV